MLKNILIIAVALLAVDGLILIFYPSRIHKILNALTEDNLPAFLQGNRVCVIGILEMLLGLSLLFYLYLTRP